MRKKSTGNPAARMTPSYAPRERVRALDVVRGLMILLMVGHHLLYDLVYFYNWPRFILENGFFAVASPLGAGIFIIMSGATTFKSRSNAVRGLRILAAAAAVTITTYIFDKNAYIVFGILHFLGVSSLLYAALAPVLRKIPQKVAPFLYIALFFAGIALKYTLNIHSIWLIPLGFPPETFYTMDYFPLVPWFPVYLFGTWFGSLVFSHRLPEWFYRIRSAFLERCGRWSLWIYLLHQPVLLAVVPLIYSLTGKG